MPGDFNACMEAQPWQRLGRQRRRLFCLAVALALLAACASPPPRSGARAEATGPSRGAAPPSFAAALARGLPYAVGVYAVGVADPGSSGPDPGGSRDGRSLALEREDVVGAGVVLRADGLIATAAHVVQRAARVIVKLQDERVLVATTIGIDDEADVALLKVDARWPGPPPIGRSARLSVGDWVLAVGDPFGLQRSVSAGIVGGPVRHFVEDRDAVFIQAGIALNPGQSGGPLLDLQGAIVGMNARSIAGSFGMAGMSLTLPIELVLQVAVELEGGSARPRLGALFEDLLPPQAIEAGLGRASGAVLRAVSQGGPAAHLGLRPGDIVVGLEGQPVSDSADLARLLLEWRNPSKLRATVYRAGRYTELRLP